MDKKVIGFLYRSKIRIK